MVAGQFHRVDRRRRHVTRFALALELVVLPGVVHEGLPGPHAVGDLHPQFERADIIVAAHPVAIADAARLGVLHPDHDVGLAAIEPVHQPVVAPHAVDRPAGMAAGHHQRIVAADLWRGLVGGQVLVVLEVQVVVDIELDAPGLRRIRVLVVQVVGERNERLALFQLSSIADSQRRDADVVVAGVSLFLLLFPRHVAEIGRRLDDGAGRLVRIVLEEAARHGHVFIEVVELDRLAEVRGDRGEAAFLCTLLQVFRQHREDPEVGLCFAQRFHGLVGDVVERHQRRHPLVVGGLVPGGGGQDVVRPHGGGTHAEVDRDRQLELGPQHLQQLLGTAHRTHRVGAVVEHDARVRSARRLHRHPVVVERLDHRLLHRLLQARHPLCCLFRQFHDPAMDVPEHCRRGPHRQVAADVLEGVVAELLEEHLRRVARSEIRQQVGADVPAELRPVGIAEAGDIVFPAVVGEEGEGGIPGARLAHLAAQHPDQDHGALGQVAMKILVHGAAGDVGQRLCPDAQLGELLDDLDRRAGHFRYGFEGVGLQPVLQQRIDRAHPHLAAIRQGDFRINVQHRLQRAESERLGRCRHRTAHLVHQGEAVRPPALRISLGEQLAGVHAHQQRQVGLLGNEGFIDVTALDDLAGHCQRQRTVGAGVQRHPQVSLDGRGRVVGRNAHDLRPVVLGLGEEVRIGDRGHDGVAAPEQDHVGEEIILDRAVHVDVAERLEGAAVSVTIGGVRVERDRVGQLGKPGLGCVCRAHIDVRPHVPDDAVGAFLGDDIEKLVRDVVQRFVPADARPLAGPALARLLQRVADAAFLVHALGERAALLTTARVHVGYVRVELRIVCRLLLAEHDAIAHIDVEGAVGLVPAIDHVGAADGFVPGPLVAVDVDDLAVVRRAPGGQCRQRLAGTGHEIRQRQRGGYSRACLQEIAAGDLHTHWLEPPLPLRWLISIAGGV